MANTYTKLFHSILDSTIWLEPLPVKVTWITMMAMADADGVVLASVPGLAHRAGVSVEECREAIAKFSGPDPESRTKEFDGRRIDAVEGGWKLLNHGKYRNMMSKEERREYLRIKQAEYRARRKSSKLAAQQEGATEAIRDGLQEVGGNGA